MFEFDMVHYGRPVPKNGWRTGPAGNQYLPKRVRIYEAGLRTTAAARMLDLGLKPANCPLEIYVKAFFKLPSKAKQDRLGLAPDSPHTDVPDGDNLLKSICDGIKGIVCVDDSLFFKQSIEKRWTGSAPRVEIRIIEHLDKTGLNLF